MQYEMSKTGRKIRKDSFEYQNDMDIVIPKLKELYLDRNLSTNQIPPIFYDEMGIKISSAKCYNLLHDIGILRSKSESVSLATSKLDYSKTFLNEKMIGILDGIVMGDGTMNVNNNTKVASISISGSQKEFIQFCKNILSPYDASDLSYTPSNGVKDGIGIWTTRSKYHPDLYTVYKRWYNEDGIKDVPNDVSLHPLSIMLWYLGDGSISSRSNSITLYFSTNSFSKDAIQNNLSNRMEKLGFFTSRITKDNRLFIKTESIVPLLNYMGGESPVKCYSYKFHIDDWRKKKSIKEVSILLDISYGKLAALVKSGFVNHSRSPGGKKVLFSDQEFEELSNRISNGEIPREKSKKVKTRPKELNNITWDAKILKENGETDEEYLKRITKIFISNGFPHKKYSKDKMMKEWFSLKKSQYIIPTEETIKYRRNGLSFADCFHPHLFSLNRKNKISPISLFNDPEMLSECLKKNNVIKKNITYAGIHSAVCSDVRSPRLNNFPPLIARDLYNYYCKDGDSIIDPCAGFGGRLIGASVCKRKVSYTGIDPSEKTYFGLVETQKFIKEVYSDFSSRLINGCAEEELIFLRDSSFNFCFTSPPYFDTEEYDFKDTQSYIRYNDYGLWKEGFLMPMMKNIFRVLKNNCYFLINIGEFGSYNISQDIEKLALNAGFTLEERKNIAFPIYGFTQTELNHRLEPLFVLKKN
jgi:SAM-dependent methyltransferase